MTLALATGFLVSLLCLAITALSTSDGDDYTARHRPRLRARMTGLANTILTDTRRLTRAYGGAPWS